MSDEKKAELAELETQLMGMNDKIAKLRSELPKEVIQDYPFKTLEGEITLSECFSGKDKLLVIHNMGQACRYCTAYADGINGVLHHLENAMSVLFVSKDDPQTQRDMALSRGWKFRTASHQGGDYMKTRCAMQDYGNMPGAAVYGKENGQIVLIGQTYFGPGDFYSPIWPFLALGGIGGEDWTAQFRYWQPPKKLDDGGENRTD